MILLASTCISQIFETLIRLCKCAYRFEYNPARNPSDRYVHDQATVTSIRKSSTGNFLLQSQSFGVGASIPSPCGALGRYLWHRNCGVLNSRDCPFNKMYRGGVITSLMVVVVLGFYVSPTAKVIRRRDLGLKSHPKDCKLDGDGGTQFKQFKWGCQLYCNIISRSTS